MQTEGLHVLPVSGVKEMEKPHILRLEPAKHPLRIQIQCRGFPVPQDLPGQGTNIGTMPDRLIEERNICVAAGIQPGRLKERRLADQVQHPPERPDIGQGIRKLSIDQALPCVTDGQYRLDPLAKAFRHGFMACQGLLGGFIPSGTYPRKVRTELCPYTVGIHLKH